MRFEIDKVYIFLRLITLDNRLKNSMFCVSQRLGLSASYQEKLHRYVGARHFNGYSRDNRLG